jgi:hypothetical protein
MRLTTRALAGPNVVKQFLDVGLEQPAAWNELPLDGNTFMIMPTIPSRSDKLEILHLLPLCQRVGYSVGCLQAAVFATYPAN